MRIRVKVGRRRSPIWKMPLSDFEELVSKSLTCGDVLRVFGLPQAGNNWGTVKKRCEENGISFSHFDGRRKQGMSAARRMRPDADLFVVNSDTARSVIRKRILKGNLLEYKCSVCGMLPEWYGSPLSLVLDHENGIPNDHRLSNLRFLCPNCNSQLSTFAGRKRRKIPVSSSGKDTEL